MSLSAPVIKFFSKANRSPGNGDGDTWELGGSAAANSLVSLFEGNTLLGTTTADATGAWTFETGFDRIGSFTAMGMDAAGNTSPLSLPFKVAGNAQEAETRQRLFALAMMPSLTAAASVSVNDTADHIINAAESTAVAFTVSGLAAGATGAVTFTDIANHQVVVRVGGNGTYSANLSALADGTVTSALSATDTSGNNVIASGNAVPLDTDSTLTPSLSVDATNPAHVTFTVSGLEGDESGTVTFTDGSNHQDVVAIGSNGAYAANLSNLTDGTITWLLRVTDPAGNVITVDPPVNLGDGSANAPAGTPQMQTLLTGYALRPSWNVAGVDYYVGVPSGTSLIDPATASLPSGVSRNTSTHVLTISGNNVVLNGWNFSLEGGWQVQVTGSNDTIENSYFKVGTNLLTPITTAGHVVNNINILNNIIDGAGLNNVQNGGLVQLMDSGTSTIQYNLIENAYYQFIQEGPPYSGGSMAAQVIQYNVFQNSGEGYYLTGAHGDWIQDFSSGSGSPTFDNIDINYNTFIQNNSNGNTQGLSIISAAGNTAVALKESISNNTVVTNSYINYPFIVDNTWLNGTATVANNYIDPSGVAGTWLANTTGRMVHTTEQSTPLTTST